MNETRYYRRVLRRETHRSRSVASAVVMLVLAVGAAYAAVECVLAALGAPPLLVSPATASKWLASAPALAAPIAGAAVVLGIVLVILAITPARRHRHVIPNDRLAIVVDDAVIAGALAGVVRRVSGVAPSRVRADVSTHLSRLVLTPTSGTPLDRAAMQSSVDAAIDSINPRPRLRARIAISEGTVGS